MTSTEFLLTESLLIKHLGFENKVNDQYMKGSQFPNTKKKNLSFFVSKARFGYRKNAKTTTTLLLRLLFPLPLGKNRCIRFPVDALGFTGVLTSKRQRKQHPRKQK